MIKNTPLRSQQYSFRRWSFFSCSPDSACQRLRLHDHSAAAAIRSVISNPVFAFRKIPDIYGRNRNLFLFYPLSNNPITPKRIKHFRENSKSNKINHFSKISSQTFRQVNPHNFLFKINFFNHGFETWN